jgi:uncharacterized damage-inducible protein DinB
MQLLSLLQQEMEREAITTRKMLSRIPPDQFNWQPHPKSMTLKRLAAHVAEFPEWVCNVVTTDGIDFEQTPYMPKDINGTQDLLHFFEEALNKGKAALANADIATFSNKWILQNGEQVYSTNTKYEMIRMVHSQIIHHRAQLGVYLRLLNIPVPGSYGPSADDPSF